MKKAKLINIYNENDITDETLFKQRRNFITQYGLSLGVAITSATLGGIIPSTVRAAATFSPTKLKANTWQEITRYNNYYEFSTNKDVVHILAKELTTTPWTITIEGEVEQTLTLDIEQLLKKFPQEERIYPMRCVEGWSMVIPWQGFPLAKLIHLAKPTSKAKYVEFISLYRPEEMISQRLDNFAWPYTEGLRLDEATCPLTFLATGLYGKPIPAQNGAPLRLVVPWKYGFKSSKAITHIRFTSQKPNTSWNKVSPSEYGFYGNVNPNIAHPRWSQQRENRIGEFRKRPTLLFNGYADQVASLYKGMDLSVHY